QTSASPMLRSTVEDPLTSTSLQTPPAEVTMLGVLGWIVFGLIVGAVAKLLTPGRDPGGFFVTILLGIAGSLLGGYLGRAMGWYGRNQGAGLLMSIVGAVILLAIFHLLFARRVVWRSRLTNRP